MTEHRLTIPSGAVTLEAVLHLPAGGGPVAGVVLCHPHPQYGGDMHNNVVMAVTRGLTERGLAALRFNFRGVGRSGGAYEGGKGEQDDVRAALAHAAALPELDGSRIGLAGYSFGAAMAAAAVDASVPALALVALPLGTGANPRERLAAYPHALLLIAGDSDHVCPAASLKGLAAELGDKAELSIVPGTDHFWAGHERELERAAGAFFATHFENES